MRKCHYWRSCERCHVHARVENKKDAIQAHCLCILSYYVKSLRVSPQAHPVYHIKSLRSEEKCLRAHNNKIIKYYSNLMNYSNMIVAATRNPHQYVLRTKLSRLVAHVLLAPHARKHRNKMRVARICLAVTFPCRLPVDACCRLTLPCLASS